MTMADLERAQAQRAAMTARTLEFFKNYDLLLTPATIVSPFPVEQRFVAEDVTDVRHERYAVVRDHLDMRRYRLEALWLDEGRGRRGLLGESDVRRERRNGEQKIITDVGRNQMLPPRRVGMSAVRRRLSTSITPLMRPAMSLQAKRCSLSSTTPSSVMRP